MWVVVGERSVRVGSVRVRSVRVRVRVREYIH